MQSTQLSASGTTHATVRATRTQGTGRPGEQRESAGDVEPPADLGWLEQIMAYVVCAAPRSQQSSHGDGPAPLNDLLPCCGRRPADDLASEAMEGFWAPATKEVAASTVEGTDGGPAASPTDVRTAVLARPAKPPAHPLPTPEPPPRRSWNKGSGVREVGCDSPAPASTPAVAACEASGPSVPEPPRRGEVAPAGESHGAATSTEVPAAATAAAAAGPASDVAAVAASFAAALTAAALAAAQAAEAAAASLAAEATAALAPAEPTASPSGSGEPSPGLGRYRGSDASTLSYCTGDSEVELADDELIAPPPQHAEPTVAPQPPVVSPAATPRSASSGASSGGGTETMGRQSSFERMRSMGRRKLRPEAAKAGPAPAPPPTASCSSGAFSGGGTEKMGRQSSFERMRSMGRRMRGLSVQSSAQAGAAEATSRSSAGYKG